MDEVASVGRTRWVAHHSWRGQPDMRVLLAASAMLCALLGLVHLGFGFVNFREFTPNALWFAGTGIALLVFPAMNWATFAGPPPPPSVRRLVLALDALMVVFGVVVARAVPAPQSYALLATYIAIGFSGAITSQRRARATDSAAEQQ